MMLTHKLVVLVLVATLALVACQPAGFNPTPVPMASPMPTPISIPTSTPTLTLSPTSATSPLPIAVIDSGIRGTVTIGPTCPGPQRIGQVCTKPYAATLIITHPDGTDVGRVTSSEIDGSFSIDLPAGDYIVAPLKDPQTLLPMPRMTNVNVTVKDHAYTQIDIQFDTGMR